jgi:hypothetical protein
LKKGRRVFVASVLGLLMSLGLVVIVHAQGITGTIRGAVDDSSGAAIPGATVKITNTATGVSRTATTGNDGTFVVTLLPPGTYIAEVSKGGFKTYTQTNIAVTAASTYVMNAVLQVGAVAQTVEVKAAPIQIDKTTMQLGGQLAGTAVTDFPLLNQNWLSLQQTLPGVVASSDRFGTFATNGNRTQSNDFMINGTDANDLPLNTPLGGGVLPLNPDSIQEVKVVDSSSNPEYGRSSGATENVVTKSGTNSFHGSAFDYYRTTGFNARSFFQPTTPPYHQHQFGATVGGPVLHNKLFFFFSYEGVRNAVGASASTTVFTHAERGGDWSSSVSKLAGTDVSPFPLFGDLNSPCPVSGGNQCSAGTPYSTLFSTGVIPTQDFNPVSVSLMNKYVPDLGSNTLYAFANNSTNTADQYTGRMDLHPTSSDSLWFYFFVQPLTGASVLPFTGATVPGFGSLTAQNFYRYTLDETHILNSHMVNEFRIGWQRFHFLAVVPQTPTLPSSAGFTGITPQDPAGAGIPSISLTGFFALGFSRNGPQPRIDDTGELSDNFSYATGQHNIRLGTDIRRSTVYNPFFFLNGGSFSFGGSGTFSTGLPGVDYLLGIPDSYGQSSGSIINARGWMIYNYLQDQWQMRRNLTLTYGIGWQIATPLTDLYNNGVAINAFAPGKQSTVFPTAPTGLLFPGDQGINSSGGVSTKFNNFGPRLGFAYSPTSKLVVRGGWGIYYNQAEEELTLQNLLAPPFSLIDGGVGDLGLSPSFTAPFTTVNPADVCVANCGNPTNSSNPPVIAAAASIPNKYPFTPPKPGSPVDFGFYEPFSLNVTSLNWNLPYVMNMNLTTQYQLTHTTVVTLSYVGSLGRKLEGTLEANPYNVQSYLNWCDPADIGNYTAQANSSACVKGRTFGFYHHNIGTIADSTIFSSVGTQSTYLTSNYNSLQLTVEKAMSHGLYLRGAYTYSHALDYGSSYENSNGLVNPFNYATAYGDSTYDARHRLVLAYQYNIPNWSFGVLPRRLTNGWGFSGITTFQTGFPIPLSESDYRSYACSAAATFYGCWDRPNVVGTVTQLGNPRTSANHAWFNKSAYAPENYGTIGNAGRNLPFHGPGINTWDFSFWKNTSFTEDTQLQLRVDLFNMWNHANFANPSGNVNSGTFGEILNTNGSIGGRIMQLSAHLYF